MPVHHFHINHGHQLCPVLPRCRRKSVRVSAGRRAPGGSSCASAKGRARPESEALRKFGPPNIRPPLHQTANADQEQFEVPSLGWMWQVGSGSGNAAAAQTSEVPSRPMPSAVSTVINLYEDRIKAKKSLGQNFLTDDGVLQDIVVAADVGPGDLVLEVGPGTGNLTKHLLARGARVTAVEKDDTLYGRLQHEYRDTSDLTLVHGDAVKVGLEDILRGMLQQHRQQIESPLSPPLTASSPSLLPLPPSSSSSTSLLLVEPAAAAAADPQPPAAASREGRKAAAGGGHGLGRKVKVVANLPYNITKDLLTLLMPLGDLISDLHIMIQHEAAVRLTERTPGGPEWRAANIRTLFYSRPRYRFRISRFRYDPVPGVDGALVTFSLLPPGSRPTVPSERGFHALVAKAFSERRKKMRNSLQPLYSSDQVESALAQCGLNVDGRAQDLSLEQFVAMSWRLHQMTVDEGMGLLQQPQQEQSRATAGAVPPAGAAGAGAGAAKGGAEAHGETPSPPL